MIFAKKDRYFSPMVGCCEIPILYTLQEPFGTTKKGVPKNYTRNNILSIQVPSREVDKSDIRFWSHWNKETKELVGL